MLEQKIKDIIAQKGAISIADFMNIALTDDEFGYYRRKDPLGTKGDFTTAPEISQMFGELIGAWFAASYDSLNAPKDFIFVEAGAGRGTLLADILRTTAHIKGFNQSLCVHIIEINEDLRALQKSKLGAAHPNIDIYWHDDFTSLPAKPMIFVANEFFDALAIHQFEKTPMGWREKIVTLDKNNNLAIETCLEETPKCDLVPKDYGDMKDGSIYETSPESVAIIEQIATHIHKYNGVALIIDYGYFEKDFLDSGGIDTMQAVKNHQYHDILEDIGQADITAHVNFTQLQRIALKSGVNAYANLTQFELLSALGIDVRAASLCRDADDETKDKIQAQAQRLASPSEMGTLFKCMAITNIKAPIPFGFK